MTAPEIPDGFEEWLHTGIEAGYCSEVVCNTHDGLPSTSEEDAEWEGGGDPCVPAVRLFWSMEQGRDIHDEIHPPGPMTMEAESLARMVNEAARRSQTDPEVAAHIEQTCQILARLIDMDWMEGIEREPPLLIRAAASFAITLHDPMDGRPFL